MELNEYEIQLIEVRKVLTEYKTKFEELIKTKIQEKDKIASGNLLASISTKIEVDGSVYTVILNSANYLKYLETGTKPHWPPTEPILRWVKDKRLPTRELTGDKSLPTEKQLAYLIGRAMAGKSPNQAKLPNPNGGTEPNYIIAETIEELNEIYLKRLQEALEIDIYNAMPIIKVQLKFSI